ncbi:MAG: adenosylcobinamide-phosphate synthase CbiB [Candidatus Thiodiazotropha sp.]
MIIQWNTDNSLITISLIALVAVLLDWLLGEPRRAHPLVGFGRLVETIETQCYGRLGLTPWRQRLQGLFGVLLLLLPATTLAFILAQQPFFSTPFSLLICTLAIGHRSLYQHAQAVILSQQRGDDAQARRFAARMVSRDQATMDVNRATTESVLENGNDGIFGALFWFILAGAPGCLLYRLVNTLDAMWGYRNQRYRDFGWAAARIDDLFNYLPARLTALSYAILGDTKRAIRCWQRQAKAWDSPNAGPVMAAGAGSLAISLGGPACYQGHWHERPQLGEGSPPNVDDIDRALRLISKSLALWLILLLLAGAISYAYA